MSAKDDIRKGFRGLVSENPATSVVVAYILGIATVAAIWHWFG